jgi:four helix bundle protein
MDNSYKKLDAYIMAKEIVRMVYDTTKQFPDEEKFVLCNQIRRAAISVPSNIAEGLSRTAIKEQCHFLDIAFGSLMETDCQLEIARDLNYISNNEYDLIYNKLHILSKLITGLKSRRLSISEASINH